MQGTKNVVPDTLSRHEYANARMDANDAIEAYPDLGAVHEGAKAV